MAESTFLIELQEPEHWSDDCCQDSDVEANPGPSAGTLAFAIPLHEYAGFPFIRVASMAHGILVDAFGNISFWDIILSFAAAAGAGAAARIRCRCPDLSPTPQLKLPTPVCYPLSPL